MRSLVQGTIHWFDASSGEGMVETADGEVLYLHFSCIEGVDRNGYGWPTDSDQARLRFVAGQPCEFTVYQNLYSRRVEQLWLTSRRAVAA